jgi:hypothetical protein
MDILLEVSGESLKETIKGLPNSKAPGPDRIPNEILKLLAATDEEETNQFCHTFAKAITTVFCQGEIPQCLKDSLTVALRKPAKKDYFLVAAYRPIALENTFTKVLEKILADRIAEAAEARDLLPWNQMGGRRQRSTLSALQLLQGSVETAWKADPKYVVSVLGLDISGALDNVSQERLLYILRHKG